MKYYSNFILLLIQLRLVQSNYPESKYFLRKLLTTTDLPTFYSKSQITTPITSMHTVHHFTARIGLIDDRRERSTISHDVIKAIYKDMQQRLCKSMGTDRHTYMKGNVS
jgi:hypothetical protein